MRTFDSRSGKALMIIEFKVDVNAFEVLKSIIDRPTQLRPTTITEGSRNCIMPISMTLETCAAWYYTQRTPDQSL